MPKDNFFKQIEWKTKNTLRPIFVPLAVRKLQRAAARITNLEEAVELAFQFRCAGIKIEPLQVRSEIVQLLMLLAVRPPKVLMEIGTAKGGTLFLFSRVAAPDALLISLDLPEVGRDRGYPPWRRQLYHSFAHAKQRIVLMQADSHALTTVEDVRKVLSGMTLDFLFVDGDHSYAGVKTDFQNYGPMVAAGGLIAFHDIIPGNPGAVGGVPQFWQEIKQGQFAQEFVADWRQGGFGIGVITKTTQQPLSVCNPPH